MHTASSLYTGAALKLGLPSVCCPFVSEQRFWSDHLKELGVAQVTTLYTIQLSGISCTLSWFFYFSTLLVS